MYRNVSTPLRTLLVLGRVSGLPTVWSNCLAGWWLSGGGNDWKLCCLLLGMSALYTGGLFLNDAFDADFDRQRRTARPIPSGKISIDTVWRLGWSWLALGILLLFFPGLIAGTLAVVLVVCILTYNATHKFITASPWLMGLCRFWVYVIAGTTGVDGLNGWPIWGGAGLAFYIVGLSYLARHADSRAPVSHWPMILLAVPILLAQVMNTGGALKPALLASVALTIWVAFCLRSNFLPGKMNVARAVSGLTEGIVLVDWLVVAPQCPPGLGAALLFLFGSTIVLQRLVPAL